MRQYALDPVAIGAGGTQRETQPYQFPYGVIPRRFIGESRLDRKQGQRGFYDYAYDSPLRMLQYLADIHPSLSLALWNALRLTCGEGDVQIIAVSPGNSTKGEKIDQGGTAAIEALWESQPEEMGGFVGIQTQLTIQTILTGIACCEGQPGPSGQGVHRVWPVDSLTVFFHRDFDTTEIMPLQRQLFIKKPKETYQGYAALSRETFFWRTMDAMVDEPYGRAPYATACMECLTDIAMMQDLRDAVHNAAWPRHANGIDYNHLYDIAHTVFGLMDNAGDMAATRWVNNRVASIVDATGKIKAADNITYDSSGDSEFQILKGGDFGGVKPAIEFLRQRIIQSLKTLPTLMGVNDGSTQTYTTVEWAIYAAGLESMRALPVAVMTRIAQLHLRLLGLPLKAVAKVNKIRTTDGMLEAQAEGLRIANSKQKIMLGWSSNEEESIAITGTGPVADPMPGAFGPMPIDNGSVGGSGTPDDPNADDAKSVGKKPKKGGSVAEETSDPEEEDDSDGGDKP